MSVLIHAHNSSLCIKGKRITRPVHAGISSRLCSRQTRPMGIVEKQKGIEQGSDHWEIDLSEHQLDMEIVPSIFIHIFEVLKGMKLNNMVQSVWLFQPYSVTKQTQVQCSNVRTYRYTAYTCHTPIILARMHRRA